MPKQFTSPLILEASLPSSLSFVMSNLSASKMKNKASTFLKQVFSVITAIVKAKSVAVKSKTSALKSRLLIFGILRNKKLLMSAINHKIHALIDQEKSRECDTPTAEDCNRAIVLYNAAKNEAMPNTTNIELMECGEEAGDDDDYPDLRHSLFDSEDDDDDELGDGTGSVIDLLKKSREDGSEFCLENEIDHVADLFIRRFHKQMKMQKQQSFKRYQEMLERSV